MSDPTHPRHRRRPSALALLPLAIAAGLAGCRSERVEDAKPIELGAIPPAVMKVAKATLPGVEFEQAWVETEDGRTAYEIRGKNDRGKTRELKVTAEGKVLEVE